MAERPGSPGEIEDVERWLLSRGLPHFIHDYSASRDVLTRALPILTLLVVLELIGALNFTWSWWANLIVVAAGFGALVGVWALVNRVRGRPVLARPERVGTPEVAVFVFVPAVLPLIAGGQVLTAVNTLAGNCLLLGLIYFVTSYGVIPMTRWAGGRLWAQLGALLGLLVRALPLLLLFVVFLFLTTEVWEVAASLNGPFMGIVIGLFVALGVLFVVSRIPREVGELAQFSDPDEFTRLLDDTPARGLAPSVPGHPPETPPLSKRQWGNVGLVVLFSQGLQVVFVSAMIWVFLVAFGLLTVTPATAARWAGIAEAHVITELTLWGRPVALTSELLQVAGLVATVAGFSFTLSLLTDAAYRREFLEDVLCEVREAFAVRAAYLAALRPAGG